MKMIMMVVVVVMVMVMDQVGALGDCHLYVLQGFWAVRQHMVSGLIVEVGPVAQLQKKHLGQGKPSSSS